MEDMEAHHHEEEQQPLLASKPSDEDRTTMVQQAISQTFKSVAHLANHLPTGTVLAFQVLSPILTNLGRCTDANRTMTACLVVLCGLSCFVLSFTDSFQDKTGKIRYGLATFGGMWIIDGAKPLPPEIAANYSVKFVDFVHAFMSVLIFAAVALFDKNVVSCFYPVPSEDMEQVLTALPVAIGVFGSAVFVTFPTTRHGIGFPVSPR
ncbi:protein DMP6-like [Phoenix dactylifera]|uniref:Protein DMP6-like n=1 Tax=Phoenix dactylifera TaxID=42345 RepID=A0A8B7D1J2_PHODC|nr:protein DMP6-like [Phoenix dactylifera]